MDPIIKGGNTSGIFALNNSIQTRVVESDPLRGVVARFDIKTIATPGVEAYIQRYINNGYPVRVTQHQGVVHVEVVDNTAQFNADTWHMQPAQSTVDVLSHRDLFLLCNQNIDCVAAVRTVVERIQNSGVAYINAAGDIIALALEKILDVYVNGGAFPSPGYGGSPGLIPIFGLPSTTTFSDGRIIDTATGIKTFIRLKLRGSESFYDIKTGSGYTLRHTTNAAANWGGVNITDLYTGQIYSTSALLDEVLNSDYWTNPINERQYTQILTIEASHPPAHSGYRWGWLKMQPSSCTTAYNRIEIAQDYQFAEWSTSVYTPFD